MSVVAADLSDAELAARTAKDPVVFGELYRRHERAVLAYFLHWSASAEVAADLTAETFACALASIGSYDPGRGEVRAWLFGIARHVFARSLERGRVKDAARQKLGMATVKSTTTRSSESRRWRRSTARLWSCSRIYPSRFARRSAAECSTSVNIESWRKRWPAQRAWSGNE